MKKSAGQQQTQEMPVLFAEGDAAQFDMRKAPFDMFLEFTYVEKGKVRLVRNKQVFVAEEGELILSGELLNRYSVAKKEAEKSSEYRYRRFMIDMQYLSGGAFDISAQRIIEPLMLHRDLIFFRLQKGMPAYEELLVQLDKIKTTMEQKERFFELKLKSQLFELLHLLLYEGCICVPKPEENRRTAAMKQAMAYIANHYAEEVRVEELANLVHYSEYYFMKCFKQYTGKTVSEYVTQYRLMIARTMLQNTNDSVTDICYNVGFANPSYFISKFSQMFGKTPNQIRKEIAEK